MPPTRTCPKCGAEITGGALDGLCPKCVASLALATDPAAQESPRAPAPVIEKPGDRIGRYKLLQQIGEGGCGIVYMAQQEEPVRRQVALKIIKLGMDTRSVIGRFEAERQALALMDHPNIAKVFDAGATESPLTHPPGPLSPTGGDGRGEGESAESQIANRKPQ